MRLLTNRWIWATALAAAVGGLAGLAKAQAGQAQTWESGRTVESVLPALVYGPSCASEIKLENLSDREVTVEIEGHRASGALVGLAGMPGNFLRLAPHQRAKYKLEIDEETTEAWVKVRERAAPGQSPALAVSAASECITGDQLRSVRRDVVFPQPNPGFDSDISSVTGGVVSLINTSPFPAIAHVCYSSGNLYSAPSRNQREFAPICNIVFDQQVPPFGAREFPVERDGNSHFLLQTAGVAIVLELLRPLDTNVKLYRVDSSIRFDGDSSTGAKQ